MASEFIGGIDIGGTKIACAIGAASGELVARDSFSTEPALSPEKMLGRALNALKQFAEINNGELTAIGLSCPGPLDFERGHFLAPPNLPQSWHGFPVQPFVEDALGLPVAIENDANAAAVGEHLYGAGRGYRDLVYLTISTGIGGGIIADKNSSIAGARLEHMTVQSNGALRVRARGCLEASCSGSAIARAQKNICGRRVEPAGGKAVSSVA